MASGVRNSQAHEKTALRKRLYPIAGQVNTA
jgi:hypothetical protein